MTPEEKAEELVFDKFYLVNSESIKLETGEYDLVFSLSLDDAKQCALIAVDEILKVIKKNFINNVALHNGELSYWDEVKQEIEKL